MAAKLNPANGSITNANGDTRRLPRYTNKAGVEFFAIQIDAAWSIEARSEPGTVDDGSRGISVRDDRFDNFRMPADQVASKDPQAGDYIVIDEAGDVRILPATEFESDYTRISQLDWKT